MSDESVGQIPLSPAALLEALAARLDRLHAGTDGLLVQAVPVRQAGPNKVYGGFVYAGCGTPARARRSTPACPSSWPRRWSGTARPCSPAC